VKKQALIYLSGVGVMVGEAVGCELTWVNVGGVNVFVSTGFGLPHAVSVKVSATPTMSATFFMGEPFKLK
jgi:hypothetical protein